MADNRPLLKEALLRVNPFTLDQLLHATIDAAAPRQVIALGLAASPGAATGIICFSERMARFPWPTSRRPGLPMRREQRLRWQPVHRHAEGQGVRPLVHDQLS